MSGGFTAAPGTNYSVGDESIIAQRLDRLGKALNVNLVGISGYRTSAHSVAVGGFADDPHTKGAASDTQGAENIPESTLERYGLTRPLPGASEANHIQLLPASSPSKKGGGGVLGAVVTGLGDVGNLSEVPVLGAASLLGIGGAGKAAGDIVTKSAGDAASAASPLTGWVGDLLNGIVSLVGDYALRFLEIVGGGIGVIISLVLLARAAGATPAGTAVSSVT